MAELWELLRTIGGAVLKFQMTLSFGSILGIVLTIGAVLIYLLVFHTANLLLLSGKISEVASHASKYFERDSVAKTIRGTIMEVSQELNKENPDIAPYDLKIEWVKQVDRQTFINDNQVIVRMHHHSQKTKNIVVALSDFVEKGVIPKAKKYVDSRVSRSADLTLVRRILATKYQDGLDCFDDEILNPLIQNDPEINSLFQQLVLLDDSGMLTQIILREFALLGKKLHPHPPNDDVKRETREFITYLYRVASKERGEDILLAFNRNLIKVSVVIVAKNETVDLYGASAYSHRIDQYLSQGIETIYVIGPPIHEELVHLVVNQVKSDSRIKQVKEFEYYRKIGLKRVKSCCIALYTQSGLADVS
jgi:small subunit ribosomal protein S1